MKTTEINATYIYASGNRQQAKAVIERALLDVIWDCPLDEAELTKLWQRALASLDSKRRAEDEMYRGVFADVPW